MNKKVFVATLNWVKTEDGGKKFIPIKYSKYAPQISVEGEYVVNGSSWSVFCFNYEMIGPNKTKSYIKYLNQDAAPDNLRIGIRIALHEMGKIVAFGEIIEESKIDF